MHQRCTSKSCRRRLQQLGGLMQPFDRQGQALLIGEASGCRALVLPDPVIDFHEGHEAAVAPGLSGLGMTQAELAADLRRDHGLPS